MSDFKKVDNFQTTNPGVHMLCPSCCDSWHMLFGGLLDLSQKSNSYMHLTTWPIMLMYLKARAILLFRLKAHSYDASNFAQILSNSLIRKLSLWFQHNSTRESHDTNRIAWTFLIEFI